MSSLEDELLAFEAAFRGEKEAAEVAKPAASASAQVISAPAVKPTDAANVAAFTAQGGLSTGRLPVSQWAKPEGKAILSIVDVQRERDLAAAALAAAANPLEAAQTLNAYDHSEHQVPLPAPVGGPIPTPAPPSSSAYGLSHESAGKWPGAAASSSTAGASSGGGDGGKGKAKRVIDRTVAGMQWQDKTLLEWPEDDFRIFVGDLGKETNDDVLSHAFQKFPSFQRARVVRDKRTGHSKGYGFVSFKDPWDMTKALREMQGKYIGNRPVKVRKSTWKDRAEDGKDMSWMGSSLAVNIKDKGLGAHVKKKRGAVSGAVMPW